MDNSKTLVLVVAALFLGLMVGILGPKMFGSKPAVQQVSQQQSPAAQQQAPGTDYTLQINELKSRLQINPNDVALLVQLGNTYFDSNMYLESIEAYEKALALKPGNPNVLTDLGVMYRRSRQPNEAIKRFRLAAAADPMHFQSRMNLAVVLLYDLNDSIGAREAAQSVLAVYPQGPNADNARQILAEIEARQ
ncbi:MAG: tetratricopeptide repeat protein [bacterium]|nr:tetratricopeptide repeat protein [bacterium]MDT8366560.1 tetratricopeptide repeat protein [bacterium]